MVLKFTVLIVTIFLAVETSIFARTRRIALVHTVFESFLFAISLCIHVTTFVCVHVSV